MKKNQDYPVMYSNASIKEPSGASQKSGANLNGPTLSVKKSSFSHVNDIVGLEGPLYLKNKPEHHQLVAKKAEIAKHLIKQQKKNHALFSEYENMGKRAESLGRVSLDYGHDSTSARVRQTTLQTANMAEKFLKKSLQNNVRSIQGKKSSVRPHIKKDDKLLVI